MEEKSYKIYNVNENIIESLKKTLVDNKKNDQKAKAILLGGIPGAGKTQLCKRVLEENKNSEYVVIDVDDYRKYSPVFLQKNNNISNVQMVELSSTFCNQVAYELLEYSLKNRKNIIINTSLRETNLMLDFIKNKFIPLGYSIDICLIATPEEECIISSQERYEEQIEKKRFPRFTTIEFIKESREKIYDTIQKIEDIKEINEIKVYKRGRNKNELPIKIYSNKDKEKKYSSAIEVMEDCKRYESKRRTNAEQLARLQNLYEKRKKRKSNLEELKILSKMIKYYKIKCETGFK